MKRNATIFYHGIMVKSFFFAYYFYIDVPEDYEHSKQIESFREGLGLGGKFGSLFEEGLYSNVTDELIPGEQYMISVFVIRKDKSLAECVSFLKSQKDIVLVGTQGLLFLAMNYKDELPFGSMAISIDKKRALPIIDGEPLASALFKSMGGRLSLNLLSIRNKFDELHCILSFTRE
ncbi:MAG: hypothetical protein NTZ36_01485 [Candidatus Jorgensenbacteria bacterium]|nr:hypothetical protein [Candidatus Jorgensenbacteria bacterium]